VGHVQKVSLVPGKVHEMKTLSLKPLLFGKDNKMLKKNSNIHSPFTPRTIMITILVSTNGQ